MVAVAAAVAALAMLRLSRDGADGGGGAPPGTATVVEVVDGDTLVVDLDGHEEHVRLIGIDTPETVAPDQPDECYGAEASHHLAELVPPGSVVRLERDIEARDMYDRLLAYMHRADDDLFVNLAQVADGYAETLAYPPNTAHRGDFEEAQRRARTAGAGLWSACGSADVPIG
ncbi:MAG TPA: thermonuclease family protein [Acidimicrobiales bacterium]|nr:thermonuclease family protein [Acidimicrobiales bacterium]